MKGFSLFSDIFMLFALLGIVVLTATLIYYMSLIYSVESSLGLTGPRKVALTLFFQPVSCDSVLMSMMEITHQTPSGNSIPIKKILNAVAIQNSRNVWIDGESLDARSIAEQFFDQTLTPNRIILKTVNPEVVIYENGES